MAFTPFRRMRGVKLGLTLVVLLSGLCLSGWAGATEVLVNTTTDGWQGTPSVARDSAGNFVITWHDSSTNEIFAQRFAADETPLGSEFKVNTNTNANQEEPVIAREDNGDFVIV